MTMLAEVMVVNRRFHNLARIVFRRWS